MGCGDFNIGNLRPVRTGQRRARADSLLRKRAVAEGYDFVLDSSGRTMNDQPTVLYYPERNNITDSVIRTLNRTRTQSQTPENGDRTK